MDWRKIQEELGCPGCVYCDTRALGVGPCCTKLGHLGVDPETGKCLDREEE